MIYWSAGRRWGGIFEYDARLIQLQEEELKAQDPEFWNSPKEAEDQMRKIRGIKVWTEGFNAVNQHVEDFLVLYEFFEAKEATESEVDESYTETIDAVEKLEAKNMLRNEEDHLGAVLKINAGAGGTESNE